MGIAGYRAHGFFNLSVEDLSIYRNFNILIDHFELSELFADTEIDSEDKCRMGDCRHYNCACLTKIQVDKVASVARSLENL